MYTSFRREARRMVEKALVRGEQEPIELRLPRLTILRGRALLMHRAFRLKQLLLQRDRKQGSAELVA